MKKFILIVPIVALLAAGCDSSTTVQPTADQTQPTTQTQQQQVAQNPTPTPTPVQASQTPTPTPTPAVTNKTYTNASYGISFSYPSTWQIHSATDSSIMQYYHFPEKASGLSDSLVITSVSIPNSDYSNSNLNQAYATIAVNNAIDDLGICSQIPNVRQTTGTKTYNNITYSIATDSGAAAGTSQTSAIYHTEHGGRCYEINLNVFTGNTSNYQGKVTGVNEQQIIDQLATVVKTLKFGTK